MTQNRSAITRLEKEISQLKDKELSTELAVRIHSISLSVSQKQKFLTCLDEKILVKIPLEQMDKEIDESMEWDIQVNTLLQHIEELQKPSLSQVSQASVLGEDSHNRSFSSISSTHGVRFDLELAFGSQSPSAR